MIFQGDCLTVLRNMPQKTVHSCVTSPPYFGLRDYEVDGQIGLEQTPEAYIARLVEVFREVRRVLKDDGTLWLNLGDSYAGSGKGVCDNKNTQKEVYVPKPGGKEASMPKVPQGLKPKDLIGIPWRVAFALQADGWYLRSDIIWEKPNAMPESVRDRPTKAHEYIFLLSKNQRYYYDNEAIKEPLASSSIARLSQDIENQAGSQRANGGTRPDRPMKAVVAGSQGSFGPPQSRRRSGNLERKTGEERGRPDSHLGGSIPWEGVTRNKRTVWTVPTKPFKGAHFAVFPPDLIRPCILAGTPVGGIVLDPFFGAGTTGIVATQTGRDYMGIELNPDYVELSRKRLSDF